MPRQARLDLPGYLYHVIARGLDRRPIFLDSEDRSDFLSRVEKALKHAPTQILAWALMPNHFHFLVRPGTRGLAPFMRSLMSGYALAFNRRHQRSGYLFQNRFKSTLCEEGPYLLELVRYIHLNPVRGRLVKDVDALKNYRWTGHWRLMGGNVPSWQDAEEILKLFSPTRDRARRLYETFLRDGLGEKPRQDLLGGGLRRSMGGWIDRRNRQAYDAQVLGSGTFVEEVLKQVVTGEIQDRRWSSTTINELADRIGKRLNVDPQLLFKRGRSKPISRAKSLLIFAGIEKLGETQKRMADIVCVTPAAVTRARLRGQTFWQELDRENPWQVT